MRDRLLGIGAGLSAGFGAGLSAGLGNLSAGCAGLRPGVISSCVRGCAYPLFNPAHPAHPARLNLKTVSATRHRFCKPGTTRHRVYL